MILARNWAIIVLTLFLWQAKKQACVVQTVKGVEELNTKRKIKSDVNSVNGKETKAYLSWTMTTLIIMTMNQESTKQIDPLDPVDLEPITNNSLLDFILLTRDRYALAVVIWILLGILYLPLGIGLAVLDVIVTRRAFKRHKKEEDRMNKIKQELWKIKLTEINWLSQF